jgi:serine/threonine-protein kinase RsbW
MTEPFDVRLRLPARAENVAVVRQALAGMAESLNVESNILADMKTAVTEACNNVVVHAYPDSEGTLEVDLSPEDSDLTVVVRDFGMGMQPRSVQPDEPTLGLGLPLIAALSNAFEIHGGSGRGIEVRMRFGTNGKVALGDGRNGSATSKGQSTTSRKPADISITPGPIMAPVLGRVTAMLASRSQFPLDRLSDAVLVTDAISAHVGDYAPGRHATVALEVEERMLEVRVGPLVEGGADELLRQMELPGLERSLDKLADEVKVERTSEPDDPGESYEFLQLRLSPRATGAAAS